MKFKYQPLWKILCEIYELLVREKRALLNINWNNNRNKLKWFTKIIYKDCRGAGPVDKGKYPFMLSEARNFSFWCINTTLLMCFTTFLQVFGVFLYFCVLRHNSVNFHYINPMENKNDYIFRALIKPFVLIYSGGKFRNFWLYFRLFALGLEYITINERINWQNGF